MWLHWHRRDLRVRDNKGLAARADETIQPIFVFDPDVLRHGSPARVAFLLDALDALRDWYRDCGSDLVIAKGRPWEVLPELVEKYDAEGITWNHDYSGLAHRRDEDVVESLKDSEIAYERFHDAVHHEPGAIRTNDGKPYSVFSYFWKKWTEREKEAPFSTPTAEVFADAEGETLPSLDDLGFDEPEAQLPAAGMEPARDRLDTFCNDSIYRYDEIREYPASKGTSRLSQDLKYGTLGVREAYAQTEEALDAADTDAKRESVESYQRQLAWREFYTQVLYFNPNLVTENYKDYRNEIQWRSDADELNAWKDGETGYPIVDAGMRQLRTEAFMHNRTRMIVGSFLTKDLMHDWREGYDWFRERLVDHETANDNGNWQWIGSTGTDAQPYFRVFNPMTQGESYDPDAEYIKAYVPELRGVDSRNIHRWHELDDDERESIAPDYPAPIVDHSDRREQAVAMFESARGKD
ncbi:cryptochrome/photolyase family protein [Halocatena marina]|uniref:cryptochrome/photolyase family protein n=1 Tax=Halocatena marina TaxID=2934937 RepID=UPI00200C043B|nr:deoxyribodipyrimidine photo-lyase [Halocatena marina]